MICFSNADRTGRGDERETQGIPYYSKEFSEDFAGNRSSLDRQNSQLLQSLTMELSGTCALYLSYKKILCSCIRTGCER